MGARFTQRRSSSPQRRGDGRVTRNLDRTLLKVRWQVGGCSAIARLVSKSARSLVPTAPGCDRADRKLRRASSYAAASSAPFPASVSQRTSLWRSANDPALRRWSAISAARSSTLTKRFLRTVRLARRLEGPGSAPMSCGRSTPSGGPTASLARCAKRSRPRLENPWRPPRSTGCRRDEWCMACSWRAHALPR